jgi:ribosomal protein S18 acetylase RimI-like enzyme
MPHYSQPHAADAHASDESDDGVMLVPASEFTFDELVTIYNQGRIDYIVPMPMSAISLREYVCNYDVNLEKSVVAMLDGEPAGLNMLGVRPGHTWVTRLEVLPNRRRCGLGQRMMTYVIERSKQLEVSYSVLEVIKDNQPAFHLFHKLGFREARELLVIRRPPSPPMHDAPHYAIQYLDHERAIMLLRRRQSVPSWLDEIPSLLNAGGLDALRVELENGDRGWLVYQKTPLQVGRLVLQTEVGDPHQVGLALIHALYARFPNTDTKSENLPVYDPHWPALQEGGFIEAFRRIEMRLDMYKQ